MCGWFIALANPKQTHTAPHVAVDKNHILANGSD